MQPLNPFAGEVSQVISISLPSSVPAVKVDFRVNVFENPYVFNAFVGHTDAMEFWQQVDPVVRATTTVFLSEVPLALNLIVKIEMSHKVLPPNGDKIGDQTEIRLAILKSYAPVVVNIYSLDGQLVGSLTGGRGNDGFRIYPWNGDDAPCQRVPPMIYLARIDVAAQTVAQRISQIVSVVY